ncbi:MAG: hypothetical protein KBD52_01450 [Candidatus Pacebacteria bacterium]|nr:hypothetical protein [Candidatus Paceibacterota bacterium]
MKNIKNKLKHFPLVFSIIFFIFSCIIFVFLHKEVNKKQKIAQEIEVEWEKEEHGRNNFKKLESVLKETEEDRTLIEEHFVYSSDIVPFLDMIEELAPKVEVDVKVSLVDILKDNTTFTVDLNTEGSFENIYNFISLLENNFYELEFMKIDMKKEGEDVNGVNKWRGAIKIKVLSFIP